MGIPTCNTIAAIENVAKTYGDFVALDNINLNLNLNRGEILSILGPNGAGKTTLINLMLGRLSFANGSINVFGLKPGSLALKRLCGAMLQVADLPETLTVKEHIHLFQSYYGAPMSYQKVIEYAGLSEIESKLTKGLSGGQKQRVLFALAICGNPKLLFLDEPTVGMDVEARHALWKAIQDLKAQGTSIILTTHYLEEADFLSDRIVMLNQGRIIQEGSPEQIKAQVNTQKIRFTAEVDIAVLATLNSVKRATQDKHFFELQSSNASATLQHLFNKTKTVEQLTVTSAGLEEAFLQLNREQNNSVQQ
ncbi:ABC transporter ATP-binding protein [Aliikangiella marina]|uniref:ABC transporter ATP-binding protein n=1 Tax=Aliikangiella marina TaxID=1712262 RepID=UPI00163DCD23|nr:ABC transporter ATP-binding protein [Aliikangiella marina]